MIDATIECSEVHRTEMAMLVDDGKVQVWLPLSKIIDIHKDRFGKVTGVTIPEWLADDKGLT